MVSVAVGLVRSHSQLCCVQLVLSSVSAARGCWVLGCLSSPSASKAKLAQAGGFYDLALCACDSHEQT